MRLRTSVAAIVVIVSACGGAFAVTHKASPRPQQAPAPSMPVVAGTVSTQDVPIYLRGIGTVIA
jgi:multidrug efflux system membrane fusion protein